MKPRTDFQTQPAFSTVTPREALTANRYADPIEHAAELERHARIPERLMLFAAGVFVGWITLAPLLTWIKGL